MNASLWQRFKSFLQRISWYVQGQFLVARLHAGGEAARTEAEEAVARVIASSGVAPDCVSAQILRGGCTILVKHNSAWEAFVHNSYPEAADKAIEWLSVNDVRSGNVSEMNRKSRRKFAALRGRIPEMKKETKVKK